MELFEIEKLNNKIYTYLIFANSYRNPLDNIDILENELRNQGKSRILFDLLLINGQSSNRFIEGVFNGNRFERDSFAIPNDIDKDIWDICSKYYFNNSELIDNSVLPNSLKFLAKNGRL